MKFTLLGFQPTRVLRTGCCLFFYLSGSLIVCIVIWFSASDQIRTECVGDSYNDNDMERLSSNKMPVLDLEYSSSGFHAASVLASVDVSSDSSTPISRDWNQESSESSGLVSGIGGLIPKEEDGMEIASEISAARGADEAKCESLKDLIVVSGSNLMIEEEKEMETGGIISFVTGNSSKEPCTKCNRYVSRRAHRFRWYVNIDYACVP